jgi:lipopolysaccharide/colanic/teichoic acid biosynthesis glycosyltransferase
MNFYDVAKRIMDIFISLCGIIFSSPLMLCTALWIKMVSPQGPVFADAPLRVGKDGVNFKFFKFRSMIPKAHEWLLAHPDYLKKYQENNFKLDPDPRLLPGAKFMRKFSVDELPQFFNILRGEMSFVGPRAYYPFEVEKQLETHPDLRDLMQVVYSVKPGLTGLWQISGRSSLSFEDRVKLDAFYAKKRSLLYDLLIIIKTPLVVLTGKGAY